MVYKTCSINKVIAQIYRDFKPSHSGWINDAIEWIGDAISIMGVHQGYQLIAHKVKVIDYRVKIPCDIQMFLGIEYKQMRLQRSGGINQNNAKCSCLDNLTCHPLEKCYTINPNYIHITGFTDECVTLYYYGLITDCDGLPEIPDNALYREALGYYVIMKMLMRGFKHQTIDWKTARTLWLETYPRAQNDCNFPDIDNYEVFKKSWLGLARSTNLTNEFFNTIKDVNASMSNANSFNPGDKLETFLIVDKNARNL